MQIQVNVKLNKASTALFKINNKQFIAHVAVPPKDNKVNLEITKLLSENLKIPKSKIKLIRGAKSKIKVFEI